MKPVFPGPWFSIGFTAHGPLRWTNLALEVFARSAGHGIPVTVNGEPMAGASAPVTLAGAFAVGNAEILAGIVVNQILEPGRPVVYNLGLGHVLDMRRATAVTGGPENALYARAWAQASRRAQSPMSTIIPVSSQMGMKRSGGVMPCSGSFQRSRASTPVGRRPSAATCN